jgi:negative regulator of flagellin synthesis FlgM
MKINTDVGRALQANDTASTTKSTGPAATKHTNATHATPAVGSVKISEASRSLQTAGTSNAEAPFDAKKVEAIKAAISAGTFKVNPEAVAGKVIDSATQLLTSKS